MKMTSGEEWLNGVKEEGDESVLVDVESQDDDDLQNRNHDRHDDLLNSNPEMKKETEESSFLNQVQSDFISKL